MANQDQPLVTFLVPCYNSAEFMERGIESLLTVNHPCEIILVNDGSSDSTSEIAHRYADEYEQIIAVDQENTNWGGVVNRGIEMARGHYFKILDSDDSFDPSALKRLLDSVETLVAEGTLPDLLVTNFVYDHIADNSNRTIHYRKLFPEGRIFTWDEMGRPGTGQEFMVHALWFKTSKLRESELELPTGVSYMDSLFVLHPMPLVETLFYLNIDAYHYLIGREGQSVEIEVVKKHIDQQLMATYLAIDDSDYAVLNQQNPNRARMMMSYIAMMMSVSTIYLFMINTKESIAKNKRLWAYLKEKNPILYRSVRRTWAGLANRHTPIGRFGACRGYRIAQKVFKFA